MALDLKILERQTLYSTPRKGSRLLLTYLATYYHLLLPLLPPLRKAARERKLAAENARRGRAAQLSAFPHSERDAAGTAMG